MSAIFAPPHLKGKASSTAETVQKLLEENNYLIQVVVDFQNKGRAAETAEYLKTLHRNLVYLLQVADLNSNQCLPPPEILSVPPQGNGASSLPQNVNMPYASANSPQLLTSNQQVSSTSNYNQQCGSFPAQNLMHNVVSSPGAGVNTPNHTAGVDNTSNANPLSPFNRSSPKSTNNAMSRPSMLDMSSGNVLSNHSYNLLQPNCENQGNLSPLSMIPNSQKVNLRNEQLTSMNNQVASSQQMSRVQQHQSNLDNNNNNNSSSNDSSMQPVNNQNENNLMHNRSMNDRHALSSEMKQSVEPSTNHSNNFLGNQQTLFSLQGQTDKTPQSNAHPNFNIQPTLMNGPAASNQMFSHVTQPGGHMYNQMNHPFGLSQSNQLLNQYSQPNASQFVPMQSQASQLSHSLQSSQPQNAFCFSYNSPAPPNSQCSDQGTHYLSSPQGFNPTSSS